jgi:hypothetical protein
MKVELPKNNMVADGDRMRVVTSAYDSATLSSTHVRTAAFANGDVAFALPKVWDPARHGMSTSYGSYGGVDLMSFDTNDGIREEILLACRNIAKTHPVVGAAISVLSRYPIRGIRLEHKDSDMQRFYEELFLDDLGMESFMIDVGKSFWTDGTAFVFGNWNDNLGLWVGEDILDPITVRCEHMPFTGKDMYYMTPSEDMKSLVRSGSQVALDFRTKYPDMWDAVMKGTDIPISEDRLTVLANKDRPSDTYGTPTMLKAWNTLRLEDRMQSAMQATADRLYAPLIMFTVGGTLPDGTSYIPSAKALDAFRDNLDATLASNFRVMVTHNGVQSNEVIRQTTMSTFKQDTDMYDERILMAYGLSTALLKPNSGTYATSALEFQLAAQIMATYQEMLISIYNHQAAFVAEAQHHYEKDKDGSTVTERREVWDEDEAEYVVKDVPKLDFPEMKFETVSFKSEQDERKFRMELRNAGVPIADNDIAIGVDIDLDDSAERYNEEQIKKQMDEARRNMGIYESAREQGLPVPPNAATYLKSGIPPAEIEDVVDRFRNDIKPYNTDADGDVQTYSPGDGRQTTDVEDVEDQSGTRGRPEESDEEPDVDE